MGGGGRGGGGGVSGWARRRRTLVSHWFAACVHVNPFNITTASSSGRSVFGGVAQWPFGAMGMLLYAL